MTTSNVEPEGLGGWLVLPFLGLFGTLIRVAMSFNQDFLPIFQDGFWGYVTTPGSEAYHHLWAPMLIYEIAGNALFSIFTIALIVLFFTRSPRFPKLMIVYFATNLIFVSSDFYFANHIPAIAALNDPAAQKELFRTVIVAMIWIPYFFVSKRVKNTFVEREPYQVLPEANEGSMVTS